MSEPAEYNITTSAEPGVLNPEVSTGSMLSKFCSVRLQPGDRPSHAEILIPPMFIVLGLVSGLILLVVSDRYRAKKLSKYIDSLGIHDSSLSETDLSENGDEKIEQEDAMNKILKDEKFLSEFDSEVLYEMNRHYNQPKQLFKICVPAFLSLILTALIMLLYQPMTECLWPQTGRPDINAAITCFLSPAGLVYALSFGFTFQLVLEKHHTILNKVTQELSLMDQMVTMATKLNLPTKRHEMAMYKVVKSEVIFMAMLVQNREPSDFKSKAPKNIKVHIWEILDILRNAATQKEYNFNLNIILADKLVTYLIQLNNICTDRMGSLHSKIHPLKWMFLEVLGGLVLLGVMLIDAQSRRMEMAMCELTIFSVSMLCYVLADLDSPFNGFFRVDVDVLPDVVKRIEGLYLRAKVENQLDMHICEIK